MTLVNDNQLKLQKYQDKTEDVPKNLLEKLKPGDCLRYKDICTILEQPVYGGDQKKKQLNNFKRYFDYEKDKSYFIITEVYDTPLTIEHKYPSNTLYTEQIEQLLLQLLAKQEGYKMYISSIQLWEAFGMINECFSKYEENMDGLKKINPSLSVFEINDFYKRCKPRFAAIVSNAFKSLQNQSLIKYNNISRIRINNSSNGFDSFDLCDATDEQEKIILKVEYQVLHELGFKSKQQLIFSSKMKVFYERTNKIYKSEYGWDGVYKRYKIIFNKEGVIDTISQAEKDKSKKLLNSRIMEMLSTNAQNNYNKIGYTSEVIQQIRDEAGEIPDGIFYYPANYIDQQMWLTDKLIKIK